MSENSKPQINEDDPVIVYVEDRQITINGATRWARDPDSGALDVWADDELVATFNNWLLVRRGDPA